MVSWRSPLSCVFELTSKHLVYCFDHRHGGLAIKLLLRRPVQFYLQYSTFIHSDWFVLDIDECSTYSHICDVNAVCSNTVGSYPCACKGYSGNGRTCSGKFKRYEGEPKTQPEANHISHFNHFPMFKTCCNLAATSPQTKHDFYL